MQKCIYLKILALVKDLFRRRKYHAPACFEVWSAMSSGMLFIEKLIINRGKSSLLFALAVFAPWSFTGCGMRKMVRGLQTETVDESIAHDADRSTISETQRVKRYRLTRADSIATAVTIEIWPKGTFSISSEKGYVGAAESVRIHGQQQALFRTTAQGDAQEGSSSLAIGHESLRQQRSLNNKRTLIHKNPAWKWALVILAIAIGCYMTLPKPTWKFFQ